MIVKYYLDKDNKVHGLLMNDDSNVSEHIKDGWSEISIEEAQAITNPPPTQQELNARVEAENHEFLTSETRRVNEAIAPLDDAIEFEIATDEEIAQHKELRKYRLLLSRVPNQETWPLNPVWPDCPEFFKQ